MQIVNIIFSYCGCSVKIEKQEGSFATVLNPRLFALRCLYLSFYFLSILSNMSNDEEFVDYEEDDVQVDTKADEKDTKK